MPFAKRSRAFFPWVMMLGLGGLAVYTACNDAELTVSPICRGAGCTCEQDPSQPRCQGLSPDDAGDLTPNEAGPLPEGSVEAGSDASDGGDAADAELDGEADAEDQ